jgi:predicted PhzF superfamily epimerase YddE/YHI9
MSDIIGLSVFAENTPQGNPFAMVEELEEESKKRVGR